MGGAVLVVDDDAGFRRVARRLLTARGLDVVAEAATAGEALVAPYVVGTPATYGFAGHNGRTLADNAPEAVLSLVAGTAVPSGLRPSVAKELRGDEFPYVVPA
jgi:hypothetical protein